MSVIPRQSGWSQNQVLLWKILKLVNLQLTILNCPCAIGLSSDDDPYYYLASDDDDSALSSDDD